MNDEWLYYDPIYNHLAWSKVSPDSPNAIGDPLLRSTDGRLFKP